MASTTIHTLSYKMVADTANFSKGMLATKSQAQLLKKVLGDTTPEQKAQQAYNNLNKLLDAGKINVEQYERAWSGVSSELIAAERAAKNMAAATDKVAAAGKKTAALNGGGAGGAAGGATFLPFGGNVKSMLGAVAGLTLASKAVGSVTDELTRLDQNQKAAERFNMAIDDFERLQFILTNPTGADLEASSAANVIDTMRKNISLASRDMGKAKEFFGELGFEMDTIAALNFQDATSQFKSLAAEIGKIQNAGDRGLVLQKIFGTDEGRFGSLMTEGANGIQKLIDKTAELNVTQGQTADTVERLFNNLDKLGEEWQSLRTTFTKETAAPAAARAADFTANAMEGMRRTIQNPGSVGGIGDAISGSAAMGMQVLGQNFVDGEWLAGELRSSLKPGEVGLNQTLLRQMEMEAELAKRNEQLQRETIEAIREAMGRGNRNALE